MYHQLTIVVRQKGQRKRTRFFEMPRFRPVFARKTASGPNPTGSVKPPLLLVDVPREGVTDSLGLGDEILRLMPRPTLLVEVPLEEVKVPLKEVADSLRVGDEFLRLIPGLTLLVEVPLKEVADSLKLGDEIPRLISGPLLSKTVTLRVKNRPLELKNPLLILTKRV